MGNSEQRRTKKELSQLKAKIREEAESIRAEVLQNGNLTPPRTQATNRKFQAKTVEEESKFREDVVEAQIETWKKILPQLIRCFSKIPDPRRPKSIKHTIAVLMIHALFMFVFRYGSRKAINNELAKPQFHENIKSLFPEIDSIPHSDTVARLMERIDPSEIESAHVGMIKNLISKKKFEKFLISGCLPVSIDGVQKLTRNGENQSLEWLERKIKSLNGQITQQYVSVLEANITLHNGWTIPLLSEFLFYDGNSNTSKQDCELVGFQRLCLKLKSYFKRQKIVLYLDKLYACESVLKTIGDNQWKYIIVLPSKLKDINKQLNSEKPNEVIIPNQPYFNGRKQLWHWKNNIIWRNFDDLNAVSCFEKWYKVDQTSGESYPLYSEHKWITNIKVSLINLHVLCNLGGRKRWGIEDSNNTEKNRGYHYKHAYSYTWNGMICFHLVMRMAHAINALSEFAKKLKIYILAHGCTFILDFIKETLWGPWIKKEWFQGKMNVSPVFLTQT